MARSLSNARRKPCLLFWLKFESGGRTVTEGGSTSDREASKD